MYLCWFGVPEDVTPSQQKLSALFSCQCVIQAAGYPEVCTISKINYKYAKLHYLGWWRGKLRFRPVSSLARVHSRAGAAGAFLSLCRNPAWGLQGLRALAQAPLPLCHVPLPSIIASAPAPSEGTATLHDPAHPPCEM